MTDMKAAFRRRIDAPHDDNARETAEHQQLTAVHKEKLDALNTARSDYHTASRGAAEGPQFDEGQVWCAFNLHADERPDPARVNGVRLHALFDNAEAAEAYVANRPKLLRLKVWPWRDGTALVAFEASFRVNHVTGDSNEASIKRTRRFLELCTVDETAIDCAFIGNRSTLAHLRRFVGMAVEA
jgi:hypothetical protein